MKTVILIFEIPIVSTVSDEDAASMALAKLWLSSERPAPTTIRIIEDTQGLPPPTTNDTLHP